MTRKKVLFVADRRTDQDDLTIAHFKAARAHHDATCVFIDLKKKSGPFPFYHIERTLVHNDPDQVIITISSCFLHVGIRQFLVDRAIDHVLKGLDRPVDLLHLQGLSPITMAATLHDGLRHVPTLLTVADGLRVAERDSTGAEEDPEGPTRTQVSDWLTTTDITYFLVTSAETEDALVRGYGVHVERIRLFRTLSTDDQGLRLSELYGNTLAIAGKLAGERPYQQCTKCLLDTKDDTGIVFDERGVCSYCHRYDRLVTKRLHLDRDRSKDLEVLLGRIKKERRHAKYDCLLGVSGGVDSTYVAIKLIERGLTPLLVHLDNGWNSELSVKNIQSIADHLHLDLHTYVVDWSEFRDIQLAFLRASVVDIELVSDHAIAACLYNLANKLGIKYIISGDNFTTEGIMPRGWTHDKADLLHIRHIALEFAGRRLRTYPRLSYFRRQYLVFVKGIKVVPILNYLDYDKESAKKEIATKLGWKDYGTKHGESIFTRFYQNYILPRKFHVDKRKAHLSALICSGQMDRRTALAELDRPPYPEQELRSELEFVTKKLGVTLEEFDTMMQAPAHPHTDHPTYSGRHYRWEQELRRRLRPLSRLFKRITGFQHESNYV